MQENNNKSIFSLLRNFQPHFSRKRKVQFLILSLLMLVGALAELVTIGAVIPFIALIAQPEKALEFPWLQESFGWIGWNRPEDLVIPTTILFLSLVVLSAAVRLFLTWYKTRYVFALGFDIGVALYERVLHQPYSFHIARNSSETIAAVAKVQSVVNGILLPLMDALISTILSLAIIVALILIDPAVAVGSAMVLGAFYILISMFVRRRLKINGKIIAETQTGKVRAVQEGLGGIRDVLLDSSQATYLNQFATLDQKHRDAQATNLFLSQAPRFIIEALGVILIFGLAWWMAGQSGGLLAALPMLGALALGAQRLLPLIQLLYNGWSRVLGNRQIFVDVIEFLSLPLQYSPDIRSRRKLPFRREIRFDRVGFHYAQGQPYVLDDLTVTIPKGARVGLVGKTGSGKTTAMDLMMGLLSPTNGQIFVDAEPLTSENRAEWQARIAHVPQFIYLSDGSIAQNIAFGVPENEIDYARVRTAAKRAQISDFIEDGPHGYDSRVGERGVQLSGGQRQRIGIARALYKQADVLVFDEASSALDTTTEEAVMTSIVQLDKSLTIFIIAHRVKTLEDCDLVLRIESGTIVAAGSYDDVLSGRIEDSLLSS